MRDLICGVFTISIFFIALSFIAAIFSETALGKKASDFLGAKAELLRAERDFMYINLESNDVLLAFYNEISNFNPSIVPSDVISKKEISAKSYAFEIDEILITPSDWLVIAQRTKKALKTRYKQNVDAVYVRKINNFLIVTWRCKKK